MAEDPGRLVILTGMSGAGKSTALRTFEDLGYFCIDNLPPTLIGTFIQLHKQASGKNADVAVVCDVRSGELFDNFREAMRLLAEDGHRPEVLFFDCEDDQLITRYKEARRMPPLGAGMRLEEAVALERQRLDPLKELASHAIDTTDLAVRQLQSRILGLYAGEGGVHRLSITLLSFGYKYGIPADADFVFDTRFLPNPYYVEELRPLTGNDKEVYDFVMGNPLAQQFVDRALETLNTALPHYRDVHKYYVTIAFGCTGGRHRSVSLVNYISGQLEGDARTCMVQHRDVEKV
ncbi:RNase adapter RapZ [bacterium]|nr:RNase adapter RapZ [bacterium]